MPLTASCLVNNYNYNEYVVEAVESALHQTRPFDEIIVVDDGSSDCSQELLQELYGDDPRVRLCPKPNAGQLSAFHAGLAQARGDVVFFLDADDRYLPTRAEETMRVFEGNEACDAVFAPVVMFGNMEGVDWMRNSSGDKLEMRLGVDPATLFPGSPEPIPLTQAYRRMPPPSWIGSPTSGIAVRRVVLDLFLPLPQALEEDWRIRADDCLVYGLSMLKAGSLYLHLPLVEYRVHSANSFFGQDPEDNAERKRKVESLLEALRVRLGLPAPPSRSYNIALQALTIWEERGHGCLGSFERAWRLPRKTGVSAWDKWRIRWLIGKRALGFTAAVDPESWDVPRRPD